MEYLALLLALASLTSFVLLTALPWMARRYAVMRLHQVRNDVYRLAEIPGARETSIYRDLEFITTMSIRVTRQGTAKDAVRLLRALLARPAPRPRLAVPSRIDEELERVFASREHLKQLKHTLTAVRLSALPIAWRLMWCNPFTMVVGVVVVIVALCRVRRMPSEPKSMVRTLHDQVAQANEQLHPFAATSSAFAA